MSALWVSVPWNNSPDFLARAEAALVRDAAVLHARWQDTTTSADPACTIRRGPNEIWIDQRPPYRYRAIVHGFPEGPAPPATPCSDVGPTELGGTFDPLETSIFVPPNRLRASPLLFKLPPDPVRVFRAAISEGRAHDEGETALAGRAVRRIRVDPRNDCPDQACPRDPSYVYVDPGTFFPVKVSGPAGTDNAVWIDTGYLTFEYLPRTDANLALTDIRAQHPDAVASDR